MNASIHFTLIPVGKIVLAYDFDSQLAIMKELKSSTKVPLHRQKLDLILP